MPSTKPTLYALLIGINDYQAPVSALFCPHNDVQLLTDYLEEVEAEYFEVRIKPLLNQEASKEGIITAIQSHLGQAKPQDTALLFFSGHGTRERAQKSIWKREYDGLLECLVPYDGVRQEDGEYETNLLADKELRYLLQQLDETGAHVTTIFDCCHSGENTRSVVEEGATAKFTAPGNDQSQGFDRRALKDFCFWQERKKQALVDGIPQPPENWLLQGRHVQLSACRGAEVAYQNPETKYSAFVESLVRSLRRTGGGLVYHDLQTEVRNDLRGRFDQTPDAYATTHTEDLFRPFLGKRKLPRKMNTAIQYARAANGTSGWLLNLGGLHGIRGIGEEVVVPTTAGDQLLIVQEIFPDHCALAPKSGTTLLLDEGRTYPARLAFSQTPPSYFFLLPREGFPAVARQQLLNALEELTGAELTDSAAAANFHLVADGDELRLEYPEDEWVGKPLAQPLRLSDPLFARKLKEYLGHLVRWRRIVDLANPSTEAFRTFPLQLHVQNIDAPEKPDNLQGEDVRIAYAMDKFNRRYCRLNVLLENTSEKPVYAALLLLGSDFACYNDLLGKEVVLLPPGAKAPIYPAYERPEVALKPADYAVDDRWPSETIYLKVLVSNDEAGLRAAVQTYDFSGLPAPRGETRGEGMAVTRSTERARPDWATWTMRIRLLIPYR